jgi:hypothetical protein
MSHGNPCRGESPPCSAPCTVHTGVLPALLCERRLIRHETRTLTVEQYGSAGSRIRMLYRRYVLPVAASSQFDDAAEGARAAYLCYFLHLTPKVRQG